MTTSVAAGQVHGVPVSSDDFAPGQAFPLTYLYNGNILTMNSADPISNHMLLLGDRIWHCSNKAAPLGLDFRDTAFGATHRQWADSVRFIDLKGRTVLPGLTDAHVHFIWWAQNLILADLSPARSQDEAIGILRKHSGSAGKGEWIVGFGWSHNLWRNPELPTKESLDAIFPDNPVFLSSKCAHLGWVNSAALQAAHINGTTTNPPGGEIERRDGTPTGILKETAITLVYDKIGTPTEERRRRALAEGQRIAHSLGITSMQTPEDLETWGFLQRAHSENRLTMRVNFWIPAEALEHLDELGVRHGLGDDRLRISAVKLFADGSLGGRTALMVDPYEGEPENRGICVTDRDEIRRVTLKANRAGLSMAIHAIGDQAVDNVLAAFEASLDELGCSGAAGMQPPIQNRIEHLQVFHPRDLERIRRVKPIASMQPIHLCADMGPADRFWGERARYAYACRTLAEAGCLLAFGSDAPVEPINPFLGLYAATTRRNLEGAPESGWYPGQRLSLQESLEGYTKNCAQASGQQDRLGSLEAGKLADFIVLAQDPFSLTPEELRDAKPLATFTGGQCVFAAE